MHATMEISTVARQNIDPVHNVVPELYVSGQISPQNNTLDVQTNV